MLPMSFLAQQTPSIPPGCHLSYGAAAAGMDFKGKDICLTNLTTILIMVPQTWTLIHHLEVVLLMIEFLGIIFVTDQLTNIIARL